MKETLMTPTIYPERVMVQQAKEPILTRAEALTLKPQIPRLERRGDIVIMEPPKDENRRPEPSVVNEKPKEHKDQKPQQNRPQEQRNEKQSQPQEGMRRANLYLQDREVRFAKKSPETWTPREWHDEFKRAIGVLEYTNLRSLSSPQRRALMDQMMKRLAVELEASVKKHENRDLRPDEISEAVHGDNKDKPKIDISYDPDTQSFDVLPVVLESGATSQKKESDRKEALRKEWEKLFTPEELADPKTKATIEKAVASGYQPPRTTEKVKPEVIANAMLSDEDRRNQAGKHLGIMLSDQQWAALKKAHEGRPEWIGKDGQKAGVYTRTTKQLLWEAKVLRDEGGFTQEQIDKLIRSGLAATPIAASGNANVDAIIDYYNAEIRRVNREAVSELDPMASDEEKAQARASANVSYEFLKKVDDMLATGIAERRFTAGDGEAFFTNIRDRISSIEKRMREREHGIFGQRELKEVDKEAIRNLYNPEIPPERKKVRIVGPDGHPQDISYEEHVDRLFNRIYDRVDSAPKSIFQEALGQEGLYEYNELIREINEALDKTPDDLRDREGVRIKRRYEMLIQRFAEERKLREATHNFHYAVIANIGIEELEKFSRGFQSQQADYAFRIRGVTEAMHFYEQALLRVRAKYNGYIPEFAVAEDISRQNDPAIGEVEKITKQYLDDYFDGSSPERPKINDWEKRKVISLARGLNIITGRTLEVIGETTLPPGAAWAGVFGETIMSEIYPMRHNIARYYDPTGPRKWLLLAPKLGRKDGFSRGWNKKELEELTELDAEQRWKVFSGLVEDEDQEGPLGERMISMVNFFKVGGVFSHTGWRYGTDDLTSAVADFLGPNFEQNANRLVAHLPESQREEAKKQIFQERTRWMGAGLQLELLRGDLRNHDNHHIAEAAQTRAYTLLRQIADTSPLKIFNFDRKIREQVIRAYGGDPMGRQIPEGLENAIKDLTLAQQKFHSMSDEDKERRGVIQRTGRRIRVHGRMSDELITRYNLDFTGLENGRRLAEMLRTAYFTGRGIEKPPARQFVENMKHKDWRVPFVWGTDDVPYKRYTYSNVGDRAISRRIGDMVATKNAGDIMFNKLLKGLDMFETPEQVVGVLKEIYSEIYKNDTGYAREVTMYLAEAVTKFYSKDWFSRLPFGIGTALGSMSGKMSFAQVAFGRHAMAWDEVTKYQFIEELETHAMLSHHGKETLDKRVGATKEHVSLGVVRTVVPLLLLALIAYTLSRVKDEK